MNPVYEIGRYQLPIMSVVAIKRRGLFWRGLLEGLGVRTVPQWLDRLLFGYYVLLNTGDKVHFTEEEKQLYDEAMEDHAVVSQVWGMCKSAGLRA